MGEHLFLPSLNSVAGAAQVPLHGVMFRKGNSTPLRLFCAVILSVLFVSSVFAVRVYATSHTSNVAYVTDASSSSYQDLAGSNIWDNAVNVNGTNDCLPTHTSPCTYHSVTFTDVSASIVTSVSSFSGFDTVLLYQVCDIGNQTTLMSALNAFLTNGGKVVIFDRDWRAPNDGGGPNYSTFEFPCN